ncbi:IPTL-CTERM sorting domain-containing protein [Delftia acidovorans]|uniref:IPTL-CTERM sorting domain-containing protein n=1 Tax=Delftia acidovorans TaxID=80866 RepID=UPI0018E90307|nr:IPTL-CTERM sorting domain-containing protein [Delftia acidovorans]MBJ2143629.1 IPTL-CTERM sorting domain-containing protein [Delftia acidovorans]
MPTNHTPRPKSASRMLSMWFAWFIGLVMALAAPAHAAVDPGIIDFGSSAAPGAFSDVAPDYNGLRFTGQWSYFAEVDLQTGSPGITTSGDAITSATLDGNAIIKAANGTDRFSLARVRIHAYGSMTQFTLAGYRGGSPVSGASVTVTKTSSMTEQFVPIDLSALADVDEVRVSNNATVGEGGNFAFDDLAVDPFPPAAPTATALSPTSGLAAGGYPVTIIGTNFTNVIDSSIVTAVSFGGTPATSFTVDSATQITATAPAGSGTVNVTVTTAGGTSVTAAANQFTYLPAPTVASVSPNFGPQAGGTSVVITGANLSGATAVLFGATTASYVVNSATQITAISPAGTGTVDVRVTTAGGTSAISGADQFSYLATPTITSIAPTAGPQTGGTAVTITGTNFIGTTGVNFGASAATGFTVNSATSITATAPPGTGTVDIRVSNSVGTSPTVAADQFTYVAAPSVTSISPTAGPTGGGTTVIITGTGFAAAPGTGAVRFGATTATYTINSNTQITATAPAGSAGTVDVTVTTVGGTSATSAADQFTYVPAPTVTSISPTAGPTAGGTSVVITGTNFSGTTAVTFGATAATGFTVNSATQITATAPAHAAGTVDVRITTVGGTSATSAADQFTYVAAPTVTSVSPTAGPAAGGTSVVITGTNLSGATAVTFGATAATGFTVNSATQITATAPAGSPGTVDVRVTTTGGTSATGAADQFTYVATPTVTSISPTSGPQAGGTTVTLTGTNLGGATAVTFGATAATGFTVNSATQITATAPAGTGTVDVRITTAGGTSTTSAADQFTYVPAPTVTSISPTSGPQAGGTTVTLTGTNLSGATAVTFGATAATGFTVNSATQITATAPAGTGTVDVRITTVGGTSATSAADQFTYVPAPTVTSVSPASGSSIGGTTVTLTGTNFTGATAVTFGGTAATGFTVNSATQITATAPAGSAGTVDVRVTTTGGTSATGAAGQFTYVAITVTPATLAGTPKVGVSFSETLTASGGATPYTFAMASGSTLPTGLSLSPAGVISGTPTAAGAFSFTVQATDNSSISGQRTYSGSVTAATVVLTPAASTLPAARLNTAYAGQTFTASGGTAPYTYASSGTLPTGMTFNASTGVLGGTPTAAGSFTFTITATDSSTGTGAPFTSGSTSYTLVVNSTNADLSALALSSGTLAPGFGAGTLAYTATVPNTSSTVTVTATAADAGATILVNGAAASTPVALNVGSNTVSIEVTAQDGTTKKTYVVTVTREARQSASGSGVDLGIANSSPTCTLTAASFTSPSAVAGSLGPLPAAFTYPQAAVDFTAKQCAPSSTLTVTLTFASPVPANAQLMKYDATATPKWQPFTPTISGNQVSYTIVDGGLRDDDKTVNGEFVDPVILALPGAPAGAQSIPTLDRWGLLLLSLMAGAAGFMGMARRQRTGR